MKIVSFGHRCSSAAIIDILKLKTESLPFDWCVSKLETIMDCIDTKFVHFMNPANYVTMVTKTCNLLDSEIKHMIFENVCNNVYYNKPNPHNSTYHYQLLFNHKNPITDKEYYERCIERLYGVLESDINKLYIHIYPFIGINEYTSRLEEILALFSKFDNFIKSKTKNAYGLFFIMVKHDNDQKLITLVDSKEYKVYTVFTNKDFVDGGFEGIGNFKEEAELIRNKITAYVEQIQ